MLEIQLAGVRKQQAELATRWFRVVKSTVAVEALLVQA